MRVADPDSTRHYTWPRSLLVLLRFNVTFDYARGRIHLEPNSHFREPFLLGK